DELPEIDQVTGRRQPASDRGTLLAEDDDFELSPEFAVQPRADGPADSPDETYGLSEREAAPPPVSETPAETPPAEAPSGSPSGSPSGAAAADSDAGARSHAAPDRTAPAESEIDHSIATGGDALLKVALAEQVEEDRRRAAGGRRGRSGTRRGGFLVYCPNGHRIEVQERHRGQRGRCPRCRESFFVPAESPQPEADQPAEAAPVAASESTTDAGAAAPVLPGGFSRWLEDVRLHVVNPQKLKLKPGSLKAAFDPVDVGLSADGLLFAQLTKKGSLFGAPDKKRTAAAREAVRAHLAEGKPANEVPAARQWLFDAEAVRQIAVVQPIVYAHESMFGGVAVFGDGQIAVRLPSLPGTTDLLFCSFGLRGFREFARHLAELYGLEGLGEDVGVPLTDSYTESKCHYSDETLRALEHVEFYQADPAIKLKLIGRKCESCGLVVSEDSRKKEKIGGPAGKSIAKAKCPKCQQKFGNISLFAVEEEPQPAAEEPAEASEPAETPPETAPAT
ncbi:MAG TPA: hypothetical protein VML55_13895, partial [Planctomycetaceae bacterium]|nr:hypothetical protein [Planctomycetaceae bacterium]